MTLLTGQSLEQRLSTLCSAVVELPDVELVILFGLFRDVADDLVARRPHRALSELEVRALEVMRRIFAAA